MGPQRRPRDLSALQQFQQRFDRTRGFAPADSLNEIAELDFSILALCGETGELANSLKKFHRARWLGHRPRFPLDEIRDEVADVLAYLLKVCNSSGISLEIAYLEKMLVNSVRFPAVESRGRRVITIAGPDGVGKTTIVRALASKSTVCVNDVSSAAKLFVASLEAPRLDSNENLAQSLEQVRTAVVQADTSRELLFDQDPLAITLCYARESFDRNRLSESAYVSLLLEGAAVELELGKWSGPRSIVFLDATASTLQTRTSHRGDSTVPPIDWFESVRSQFERLRTQIPGVCVIPTDSRSISQVLEEIEQKLEFASVSDKE
jgi:NTP pyrophosphatase (non-canonical NTP hydrolase)/deoxyadenosine/deoxycytidine kinase